MSLGKTMDRLTRDQVRVMLLGLVFLSEADPDRRPLVFDMNLFARINRILGDSAFAQFAPQAAAAPGARLSNADVMAAAELLHQRLCDQPELAGELRPYYDLVAVAAALMGAPVTDAPLTLELDARDHLPYLHKVYIEAKSGQPDLILAGTTGDFQIPGQHPVLQRLTIRYGEGQIYPRLLLTHLSKIDGELRPVGRKEWLQKPLPRFDLSIFTYRELPLAHIRTYFMEDAALEFMGGRIRIKLATHPGDRLLCTSISDLTNVGDSTSTDSVYGKELARCVRVISPVA